MAGRRPRSREGNTSMTTRPHRAASRLSRLCLIALALAAPAATASAADAATLVVDRDQAQCPHARYASIQSAVDAARPGDTVKVCADLYPEQVTIDKPLKLRGHTPDDPDTETEIGAPASGDCLDPAAAPADPTQRAIVDPAGDGFTVALRLAADDIRIQGFVVQGASVGIDASDRYSGYRIRHNLIEHNTLFGIDFGSDGTRPSRVDHNCLRANGWGVASELDDDSLWKPSDGPERDDWNARQLVNARID